VIKSNKVIMKNPSRVTYIIGSLIQANLIAGLVGIPPAFGQQSNWTPEGLFHAVNRVATRSITRVSAMVSQDYPAFPGDVSRIVKTKYPRLQDEVQTYFDRKHPKLYSEALLYVSKHSPSTYRVFQQDLVRNKVRIETKKTTPQDLFWFRVEKNPRLKIAVMGHLDRLHPQLKFDILSRVDRNYPALKQDLFKLVVKEYPGLLWKFTVIWADEGFNEVIGL
jgi:hypothetical protein